MISAQERELPLDKIEVDPANIRSNYDPQMIAGLRSALQIEGEYINPPTVYPIGRGRYRVKHGSTRVLAAKGALKSLRVRVVEPPSNDSAKLLSQMSENLLQGSLGPADVGLALKRLRAADGHERSISQLIGALKAAGIERTKSWVSMHLTFADLAPGVRELLNAGRLTGAEAFQLRDLPEAEQIEWADRIVREHLTVADIRQALGLDAANGDSPTEAIHRDVADRLSEAAEELGKPGSRQRGRGPDADHRHGQARTRWELLPVPVAAVDQRKMRPLNAAAWAKTATPIEKQLAQEALFLGGCSAREAIDLVDRAIDEAQAASEGMMMTLNGLGRLAEHLAEVKPDSALTEFLRMRVKRVLDSIGG